MKGKMAHISIWATILSCLFAISHANKASSIYKVGSGIADVTGPAADINMMGYANPEQRSAGIHMRQFSRTFIIDDGVQRVVFTSVDCGMIDQIIKTVVKRLQVKYGDEYTAKNVLISGTHTHSGPGGFLQYLLFTITSLGFVRQTFEALVNGIILSIDRAHVKMTDANIYYSHDILLDANYNRSPASYLNNPQEERDRYPYNTDKNMTQLKIISTNGDVMGVINWYAVHLTSMNNTNPYISSDNKGYAMQLFENRMNGRETMPGKGSFVAAFANSNLGDVSPNIMGPVCIDTGLPCDFVHSSCNNRTELCIASGPGRDMIDSTRIIGLRQFNKAWEMFQRPTDSMEPLQGPVQFVHQFVDMPNYTVPIDDPISGPTMVQLCQPALGYSFAAGTTDGPGAFDFTQGSTSGNPFWNMVVSALKKPSKEQVKCHKPKPILLDTGEVVWPYDWSPKIVETQILRIGQLMIIGVPGEFTTMSGRRLKDQITKEAIDNGAGPDTKVVIAGLSNTYSHYITTFEEYQVQRYEGASVLFGPHTLSAYIDQYKKLTRSMFKGEQVPSGPDPPYLLDVQISLVPDVPFDTTPEGMQFGDCVTEPDPTVYHNDTVSASFISGHPRNNLMAESTFIAVEKQNPSGDWTVVATDAHFETIFGWQKVSHGESKAQVHWRVPQETPAGTYRFVHYGYHKDMNSTIHPYNGTSKTFQVVELDF